MPEWQLKQKQEMTESHKHQFDEDKNCKIISRLTSLKRFLKFLKFEITWNDQNHIRTEKLQYIKFIC